MKLGTGSLIASVSLALIAAHMTLDLVAVPQVRQQILEVYTRAGCPRCADAEAWLRQLQREQPDLTMQFYDVGRDRDARDRLAEKVAAAGLQLAGVPAFVVGNRVRLGFVDAKTSGPAILDLFGPSAPVQDADDGGLCLPGAATAACDTTDGGKFIDIPRLGRIDVDQLGLPVFTLLIGLIDGFNPCAMWVLLFLLSLLVNLKDRKRMVAIAGTFVVVSGVVYFAFMAAWLNFFFVLGLSRGVQIVLGLVAVAMAALNIKDFFAFKQGPSLSIPEAAKPAIYERVRAIRASGPLLSAIAGASLLAVLVNLVELLCTAGLPALYTQVLARHDLPPASYYGYLALYNLAYMTDDALVVTIAVVTLSKHKLQESGGRVLKLVGGVVMAILGLLLLFAPEWLVW